MTGQACVMCELAKSVDIMPVGKSLNKFGLLSKDKYLDLHKSTIHEGIKWRGLLHSLNFQENKLARLALVELVRIENDHIADQLERLSFSGQISCVCGLRTNGPRLRRSNSFTHVRQLLSDDSHCVVGHISLDEFERYPSKHLSIGGNDDNCWKYLSLQPQRTNVNSPPRLQRSRSLEILRPFVAMERGTCIPDISSEEVSVEDMSDEIDNMFSGITEVKGHLSADDISFEDTVDCMNVLNSTPISTEEGVYVESKHGEKQEMLDSAPDEINLMALSTNDLVPDKNQTDLTESNILNLPPVQNESVFNPHVYGGNDPTSVSVETSKGRDSSVDTTGTCQDLISLETEHTPNENQQDVDKASSAYESASSVLEDKVLCEGRGSDPNQSDGFYSMGSRTSQTSSSTTSNAVRHNSSGFGSGTTGDKESSGTPPEKITKRHEAVTQVVPGRRLGDQNVAKQVRHIATSPTEVVHILQMNDPNRSGTDPGSAASVGQSNYYSTVEPRLGSPVDVTTSADSTATAWFVLVVLLVCVVYIVNRFLPVDMLYCVFGYTFLSLIKHIDKRYEEHKVKRKREIQMQREYHRSTS